MKILLFILFNLACLTSYSSSNQLNLYVWGNEIPDNVIKAFEHETKIKVNYSSYDSNETLYGKLKVSGQGLYDVISPSSYFIKKMIKNNMLSKMDKSQLPNIRNLDPFFLKNNYDSNNQYSIPLLWGTTGIFINNKKITTAITSWSQLWNKQYYHQLLLIDDLREVFSMSLLSLRQSVNSQKKSTIQQAYSHLLELLPNIKLFASDNIKSIIIDEDAVIGMVYNNDFKKAHDENPNLQFIYPKEGFVIWVDCLMIPTNAPHKDNAYLFINFLLKAESSKQLALHEGSAITNLAGKKLLPKIITNNKVTYPNKETLARGQYQQNLSAQALELYGHYWQLLKTSA